MKHLTYDDRLAIQKGLKHGKNFSQIADEIGKDRATVSREVKARRIFEPHENGNICIHRSRCDWGKTIKITCHWVMSSL